MAKYTNILMIVAVLSVGGFLYWLNVTAQPTQSEVVEGSDEAEEEAAFAGALSVSLGEFTQNPKEWVGQRVRLDEISVASPLGPEAFWTTLSNQQPYLIRLDTAVVRRGFEVSGGDSASVGGLVHPMTDSVLDAWMADSVIVNQGQRAEAQFATTFLEADAARITARADTARGGGGGESGSGGDGSGSGSGTGG